MREPRPWPLLGIIAGGLALYAVLAAAQLPHHYQGDEFQVVERALRVGAGGVNPGLFTWPGSLSIYLTFVLYAGFFAAARVAGVVTDAASFAGLYWRDPSGFYFLARALSALFGVAMLVAAYRWARAVWGRAAGYVAAGFAALAPGTVAAAASALPDMAAAAMGAASLAAAALFTQNPKRRYAILAGVFLGLGAAAKYHVLMYIPAAAACLLMAPLPAPARAKYVVAAAVAAAAAFVAACPFALLDAGSFVRDLSLMWHRPGMARWAPAPGSLFGSVLPGALSWPLLVLAAAALVFAAARKSRWAAIAALAVTPFIIAAFARPLPPRHLLPVVAPLAVVAGGALAWAWERRRGPLRIAAVCVVAVALAAALVVDVSHVAWAWRTDSRTEAAAYVEARIPAGTVVILEKIFPDTENPPLYPDKPSLERLAKHYRKTGGGSPGKYAYLARDPSYPFGHATYKVYLAEELGDFGGAPRPCYAIRTHPDDRSYYAEQGKPVGARLEPWEPRYDAFLAAAGRLEKSFPGARRPGPTVEIYRVP